MKKFLLTIIFFLGLGAAFYAAFPTDIAHAQFNNQINYQGRLTTPSGVAVTNGNYNIQFKLYTTPTGGSPIWTETDCFSTNNGTTCTGGGTDQRITITSGLFSVMLGSTTPFTGVNFNQTLYLGVNIGGTGSTPTYDGEMMPRKILGSVPSAMFSGTSTVALTLNGKTDSQFLRNDQQNSTSTSSTFLNILQSGAGKIAEFFGSAAQSVLALLSNGNVGIGSSTPSSVLAVEGTTSAATTNLVTVASSSGATFFNVLANGNIGVGSSTPGSLLSVGGTLQITATSTLNGVKLSNLTSTYLAVDSSGNLVSTTTPVLSNFFSNIAATTTLATGSILSAGVGTFGSINATSTTGTSTFANSATFGGFISIGSSTSFASLGVKGTGGTNPFIIASSSNVQLLTVLQNGNVGIGSSTPGSLLAVGGNAYFGGNVTATGTLTVTATSTLTGERLTNLANTILAVDVNGNIIATTTAATGNSAFTIGNGFIYNATSSNEIGIGSSTPISTLAVEGNSSFPTRDLFDVASSTGTNFFNISANGNVGIGSSTPGALLGVQGNLAVAGGANFTNYITTQGLLVGSPVGGGVGVYENNTTSLQIGSQSGYEPVIIGDYQDANNGGGISVSEYSNTNTGAPIVTVDGPLELFGNGASPTNITDSNIIDAGGAVAIGTSYSGGSVSAPGNGLIVSGSTGIGTSTVPDTLTVQASAGTNPFMVSSSSGAQFLSVLKNGNVGIGSSTPGSLLAVAGTFSVTGQTTLATASSTGLTVTATSTLTGVKITNLANTFLALDTSGNLIATTTPVSTNYFANSSATTSLSTGSILAAGVGTFGTINGTSTTGTSTISILSFNHLQTPFSTTASAFANLTLTGNGLMDQEHNYIVPSSTLMNVVISSSTGNFNVGSIQYGNTAGVNPFGSDDVNGFVFNVLDDDFSGFAPTYPGLIISGYGNVSVPNGDFYVQGETYFGGTPVQGGNPGDIDVAGNATFNGAINDSTDTPGLSGNCLTSTGSQILWASCGTSGNSAFAIGNGVISNATSTDRVSVGTSTPYSKLFVLGTYGSTTPVFSVASTTSAAGATSSLLTVLANGNVGIGSSTPGSLLAVAGTFSVTGQTTLATASSTGLTVTATSTLTGVKITNLANTFLALDTSGNLIATTTPVSTNYFANSSATTSLSTGSILSAGAGTFGFINATSTTATSTISGPLVVSNTLSIGTTTIAMPNSSLVTMGDTLLGDAWYFSTSSTGAGFGSFRTNPATGNSIISAKTASIYFNFDHGTGGELFCGGSSNCFTTIKQTGQMYIGNGASANGGTANAATFNDYLDVGGGVAIGVPYAGTSTAPSNGLIVAGNVGIGSSTPGSLLVVGGDAYFGGNVTATGTLAVSGQTTLATASSTGLTVTATSTLSGIKLTNLTKTFLAVDSNGNVIATTTPSGGAPGGSNTDLQFNNSGAFGGTSFATLDSSGNALFHGTLTVSAGDFLVTSGGDLSTEGTLSAANGAFTVDGSGDGSFAGTLNTTNNTLDDGSGNAVFAGNVTANGNVITNQLVSPTDGDLYLKYTESSGVINNVEIGDIGGLYGGMPYDFGDQEFSDDANSFSLGGGALSLGGIGPSLNGGINLYDNSNDLIQIKTDTSKNLYFQMASGEVAFDSAGDITSGKDFIDSNVLSAPCLGTNGSGKIISVSCGGSSTFTIGNGTIYNATSTDRVSVGTSTPYSKLFVLGTYGSTTPVFSVASTTSAAGATSSLLTVLANGNVGIGSSTPGTLLSVAGNAFLTGNVTATNITASGVLTANSAAGTSTFVNSATFGGMIGIGTTTPVYSIEDDSGSSITAGEHIIAALRSAVGGGAITGYQADGSAVDYGFTRGSGNFNYDLGVSGDNSAITIAYPSGNVGIGSSTPGSLLAVAGTFTVTGQTTLATASSTGLTVTATSTLTGVKITNLANTFLAVDPSGNLIATTSAGGTNYFANSAATTSLSTGSILAAGTGTFGTINATSTTGTSTFTKSATFGGSVGIGTTTPATLLSISEGAGTIGALSIRQSSANQTVPLLLTGNQNGFGFTMNGIGTSGQYTGMTIQNAGTEKIYVGRDGTDSTDDFIVRLNAATNVFRIISSGAVANTLVLNGGRVSIGTSTPYSKLYVVGTAASSTPLFTVSSTTSATTGATSTLFTVLPNGTVGIGTTTPSASYSLSDVGNMLATDNVYIGASTTADVTGGYALKDPNNLAFRLIDSTYSGVGGRGIANNGGGATNNIGIAGYVMENGNANSPDDFCWSAATSTSAGSWVSCVREEIRSGSYKTGGPELEFGWTNKYIGGFGYQPNLYLGGQYSAVTTGLSIGQSNAPSAPPVNGLYVFGNILSATTTASSTFADSLGVGSTTPYAMLAVQGLSTAASQDVFDVGSSSNAVLFTVKPSGNVGIGTTTPGSTLDVGGNITDESVKSCDSSSNAIGTTASGTLVCDTTLSDERLKNDITSLDGSNALNLIDSLNPVSFYWKDPSIPGTGSTAQQFGFIAQQVQQVAPNLVATTTPTYLTPDQTYYLNYQGIIAPLVAAVQQQELQINAASSTLSSTTQTVNSNVVTLSSLSLQVGSLIASINASTTQIADAVSSLASSTATTEANLQSQITALAASVASSTTSSTLDASSTAVLASSTASSLSTSSSFIQTIANAVIAILNQGGQVIQSTGNWVVGKLSATTVISNDVQTQTLEAQTITTQTAAVSDGIQMTDKATGYIYCVQLVDGEFAKTPGTCAQAASTTPTMMEVPSTTPAPAVTTVPSTTPTPVPSPDESTSSSTADASSTSGTADASSTDVSTTTPSVPDASSTIITTPAAVVTASTTISTPDTTGGTDDANNTDNTDSADASTTGQ